MMKCPSLDQSLGHFRSFVLNSRSSLPAPLADFWYKFPGPSRSEANTMRLPSGDQMGRKSSAGSKVKRVGVPRAMSSSQISRAPLSGSEMAAATRFSSGEKKMLKYSPAGPTEFKSFPPLSYKPGWPPAMLPPI